MDILEAFRGRRKLRPLSVVGTLVCFIPLPGMRIIGGAMIGFGVVSMAGGYIGQSMGYSFNAGWAFGGALGATIGGGLGWMAPEIAAFFSTSLTFVGTWVTTAGGSMALVGGITVTGADILAGTAAAATALIGMGLMFAKWDGGWPGDDPSKSPG